MTAKTGSSYTTGITTDSIEIPTASPRFLTMASRNKVSPSDCDNDRQPEMVCSPQNRKYLYTYLELWQTGWQFQRQIWVFDHAQHEETSPRRLRQLPTTGNGNIYVLLANHAISGSCSLSQSFGFNSVELDIIENSSNLALDFRRYPSEFQRCNYFRFWGPYRYFGLSVAVVLTCRNYVLYPRFVVGILTVFFYSFKDISFSGFGLCFHYWNRLDTLLTSLRWSNAI